MVGPARGAQRAERPISLRDRGRSPERSESIARRKRRLLFVRHAARVAGTRTAHPSRCLGLRHLRAARYVRHGPKQIGQVAGNRTRFPGVTSRCPATWAAHLIEGSVRTLRTRPATCIDDTQLALEPGRGGFHVASRATPSRTPPLTKGRGTPLQFGMTSRRSRLASGIASQLSKALAEVDELAHQLYQWGWVDTTGGSFSVRLDGEPDLFAITPEH